jgi:hypothetical protein
MNRYMLPTGCLDDTHTRPTHGESKQFFLPIAILNTIRETIRLPERLLKSVLASVRGVLPIVGIRKETLILFLSWTHTASVIVPKII